MVSAFCLQRTTTSPDAGRVPSSLPEGLDPGAAGRPLPHAGPVTAWPASTWRGGYVVSAPPDCQLGRPVLDRHDRVHSVPHSRGRFVPWMPTRGV